MSSTVPKISIVTPSFNQAKYLEATIQSVLTQNYPNLEYIIIDGNSSDESPQIIKKYDDKLHYWCSEPDSGHANAINKGFAKSSGEIMAWLNSDDIYTHDCFKTVAEIFKDFPHVDWIIGKSSLWNAEGTMIRSSESSKNQYDYLLGNYRWIQQESVFWRRSLWNKAGGYLCEDYDLMIDGELWSRFFNHCKLYRVSKVLSGFRVHGENRSIQNKQQCEDEMERIITYMAKTTPKPVLNNYKKLRRFKRIPGKLFRSIFSNIANRVKIPCFTQAAYPQITWENGKWVESKTFFTVK